MLPIVILLFLGAEFIQGIKPPCGRRNAGVTCVNDEDCEGPHSICVNSVCSCPQSFELYALDQKTQVCRPAPSNVNDKCQNACRPPLVCQNGQCVCWKAQVVNNKCVVNCAAGESLVGQECRAASQVSGKCSDDKDCAGPFTMCKNGLCACVPGANLRGSQCVATCPSGDTPGQSCRKKFINDHNVLNNNEASDTCPKGSICVTYGKPEVGQCCPLSCPYGNADLSKSCKAGSPVNSKCPEFTTHFCQEFETKGAAQRLCCPRPCREPTPLYLDDQCWPLAHWGDACSKPEQCEGGVTMTCSKGRCDCKQGYQQRNYTFPTCDPNCAGLSQVSVNGICLPKLSVGDTCVHGDQCPNKAHCREGVCECDCGNIIQRGSCANPDDPLNIDGVLSGLGKLLGGGKTTPSGK